MRNVLLRLKQESWPSWYYVVTIIVTKLSVSRFWRIQVRVSSNTKGLKRVVTWRDRREGPSSILRLGPSYTIADNFSEWIFVREQLNHELFWYTVCVQRLQLSLPSSWIKVSFRTLLVRLQFYWIRRKYCWSSFAFNWQWALWSMFTSHRWKVPPVSTFFLLFKNMITIIKKTSSCCCGIRDR